MWIWLSALAVLRVTSQFSLSKRQAGAWYSWSEWGPCSRSCGSGVEVRSRSCRSLRPGGVTDCLGPARMHRTCNAEDCPAGSRDFREVQCSKYDEHDFGGRYYKWTPFYGAPNTCELNCQPKGENFYFTQAATVIDGTPCEPDKPDICIEGVCRELGCDGQLESGRLRDACGVCDGDDSACFPVHGAFTDLHLPNGYNRVLVIPNGATNIQVSEMTPSKNFLAVKSLHGEYYFNGGSTVDYGRVLPGAGTMLRYERGSDDGGILTPEMVTSTGPTTEPLVIELLTHEMNRGIKYEYYLPHDRKIVKSGVTWSFGSWSECSAECDEGFQTRHVYCTEGNGMRPNVYCGNQRKPTANRTCNIEHCPAILRLGFRYKPELRQKNTRMQNDYRWREGPWEACSVTCGEGHQTRPIYCLAHSAGPAGPNSAQAPDQECKTRGLRRPENHRPCQAGPCTEWIVGEWQSCSAECGPGEQTREVTCGKRYGCDDRTMPARIQHCNLGPCRSPEWVFADWSQCSVTCGKGTRMRSMTCQVEGTGTDRPFIVSNTECNSERMPQRIEECQGGRPCTNQIRWYIGPWGVCSVSCGGGMRKRQAICYDEEYVLQDSKLCLFQQRPRELEACNTQRCTLSQEVPSRAIPGEKAPSHAITLYEGDSHPNQPVVIPSREDCLGSRFGCCPDGITVARGPNNQGCLVPCNQTRYGCCADGMTPAKEVDRSDCPENKWSTDWRGSNQRLPSPMLVRHCQDSPYGCCPDGMSSALGYDEAGCLTVPQDKRQPGHGICNLPSDPGSCQDFAVRWFFVPESSGCNRFWYGGCDGNGNRFETKEACMMTCGSQAPRIPPFNAEANQQQQASIDVQPLPSAKPWQEVEHNRRPEHRLWIERGDPTVVEGQVGQTVELRCRAKGSHGLEREWLKDGKRLQNIRYMQFPNGSLQILMTTPDDAGIFTCKVSSGDLQEFRQVSLHFPGGLTITKPPGDLEISAGKRAEFPCTVSDKNANIIWTRNGVTLESGANHGRLLVSSDGTLMVQVVQDSDEGHYTCNAYAGSAAVSASAHLKVAPPVQAPTHNMTSPGSLLPFLAWGEHAGCVDRLDLANCKLIVQAKLCDNQYFTLFCCHSCARPQS